MAGYALADVLFGDRVPSGKLTATFPQSVGQLPAVLQLAEYRTAVPRRLLGDDQIP